MQKKHQELKLESRKKELKNKFYCANISLYEFRKEEIKMAKKKIDKQKLATRILAGILAGLMVLGVATTLIWYIINK